MVPFVVWLPSLSVLVVPFLHHSWVSVFLHATDVCQKSTYFWYTPAFVTREKNIVGDRMPISRLSSFKCCPCPLSQLHSESISTNGEEWNCPEYFSIYIDIYIRSSHKKYLNLRPEKYKNFKFNKNLFSLIINLLPAIHKFHIVFVEVFQYRRKESKVDSFHHFVCFKNLSIEIVL